MTRFIYLLMMTFFMSQLATVKAQTYELNTTASILNWTGYAEVGNFSQSGTLKVKKGTITLENDEIKNLKVLVDMTSIAHESQDLESHLKNKDFFYVEKYPVAELNYIERKGNKLICKLTIRGKSENIEIPINLIKEGKNLILKGKITIDRTKFDIKYNSSSYFQDLGSYAIKNDFELAYELFFNKI